MKFPNYSQAYCNITAGAAFCLGLRYAGTQNEEATAILDQIFKLFLNSGSMYLTECAGKPTIETCLMLVLLASSLVGNSLAVTLTFGEQFKYLI